MAKRTTRKVREPVVPVEDPGSEVEAEVEPEQEGEVQAEPQTTSEPAEPDAPVEALKPEVEAEIEPEPEVEVQVEPQAPDETPKPAPQPSETPDEPTEPETRLLWGYRCINCNQNSQPIAATDGDEGTCYRCPTCKHEWTDADEQAPFRRVQRGE